jgi:hypothetical protein
MASFDEVKLEDILHCSFATFNPDSGSNKDADSLPTAEVYAEGSSTALSSTVTVTNMATGRYRLNVTIAAADGYLAGKYYELWVSATVTGSASPVTQSAPLISFKATSKVVDDLSTTADITGQIRRPASGPVERSPSDTNPITFSWPVSGATITAEVSVGNAAYTAALGTLSFLRTEGVLHYYTLLYDAADRPAAEGTARYKLEDGTYTQYVTLRIEGASTDASGIRSAVGLASANLDSQLTTIVDDTTIIKTTANVPREAF